MQRKIVNVTEVCKVRKENVRRHCQFTGNMKAAQQLVMTLPKVPARHKRTIKRRTLPRNFSSDSCIEIMQEDHDKKVDEEREKQARADMRLLKKRQKDEELEGKLAGKKRKAAAVET